MDEKEATFQQPEVYKGQSIYWYPDGDRNSAPEAGVCTAVGTRRISISLFRPNCIQLIPIDGVPHVSDPVLKTQMPSSGAWDYHPTDKLLKEEFRKLQPNRKTASSAA